MNFGERGLVHLVLYCIVANDSQIVNFILPFAELHIGSCIRYENTLLGKYVLKCYIVKIILISFICFSEYILKDNGIDIDLKLHKNYMFIFNPLCTYGFFLLV